MALTTWRYSMHWCDSPVWVVALLWTAGWAEAREPSLVREDRGASSDTVLVTKTTASSTDPLRPWRDDRGAPATRRPRAGHDVSRERGCHRSVQARRGAPPVHHMGQGPLPPRRYTHRVPDHALKSHGVSRLRI